MYAQCTPFFNTMKSRCVCNSIISFEKLCRPLFGRHIVRLPPKPIYVITILYYICSFAFTKSSYSNFFLFSLTMSIDVFRLVSRNGCDDEGECVKFRSHMKIGFGSAVWRREAIFIFDTICRLCVVFPIKWWWLSCIAYENGISKIEPWWWLSIARKKVKSNIFFLQSHNNTSSHWVWLILYDECTEVLPRTHTYFQLIKSFPTPSDQFILVIQTTK